MIYFLLLISIFGLLHLKRQGLISKTKYRTYFWSILLLLSISMFGIKAILLMVIIIIILYSISKQRPFEHSQTSSSQHYSSSHTYSHNKMGYEEALKILGLTGNPTEEIIKEAYKKMISKYHPDVGGSDYFASKINQAKTVLLKE